MHTTNQSLRAAVETKELLGKLSPAMQGELSLIVNEATLGCVWYLCLPGIEVGLLLELASQLRTSIFSPKEICPSGFLFIIHTGRVLYIFRPRGRGSILGEDILLNNPNLELSSPAIALAYTTTEYLDRSTLATTIACFPASLVRLNVVRRRLALRRCILIEAERRTFGAKPPVHFRGRLYPIYDKDLAKQLRDEKMAKLAEKAEREVISSIKLGITLRAPRSRAAASQWASVSSQWASASEAESDKSGTKMTRRPLPEESNGKSEPEGFLSRKQAGLSRKQVGRARRRLTKSEVVREKLLERHKHASTMEAARLYGMKMRANAMLQDLQHHEVKESKPDRSHSQSKPDRCASSSTGGGLSPGCTPPVSDVSQNTPAPPLSRAPTPFHTAPPLSRAPTLSPEMEASMDALIEMQVQSSFRALVPEITAAFVADLKHERKSNRHRQFRPDEERKVDYAPESNGSQPPRVLRCAAQGLTPAAEPHGQRPQPPHASRPRTAWASRASRYTYTLPSMQQRDLPRVQHGAPEISGASPGGRDPVEACLSA